MDKNSFPEKLLNLHTQEEQLRLKCIEIIQNNSRLKLHLTVVEHAMDLADILRQYQTEDEDMKVIQILGMRMFNAFGASYKLACSGYIQNCALILRDILETVFLTDLFSRDRAAISIWRLSDRKDRLKKFQPIKVRIRLDKYDGFKGEKRKELYHLFSELAGHPTVKSFDMMRPIKNGDVVIGPFIEHTSLEAVLSEMGRLAIQVGEILLIFWPENWQNGIEERTKFLLINQKWKNEFYPS